MKKIRKTILLICVAFLMQSIVCEAKDFYPKIFSDIFKETHKSVALIIGGVDLFTEAPVVVMSGTGFFVDGGLIMTANHIIAGTAGDLIRSGISAPPEFTAKLTTGESFKLSVVRQDVHFDIAVLNVEGDRERMPSPLKLGDSSKMEVGDIVMAVGHPLGLFWSASVGIISGLRKSEELPVKKFLQMDAAINPGNSGGPLLNLDGEVVGVVVFMMTDANNISFALSINVAKGVLATQKKE